MLEHILLEPEQEKLLFALVEAARKVTRERRRKFVVIGGGFGQQDSIHHDGFPDRSLSVYFGDVQVLANQGLIFMTHSRNTPTFDVTPLGFRYYEYMKQRSGQPLRQIETEVVAYLDAEPFRGRYAGAFEKWSEAANKLWSSDSERELTTVGHLCREAMQEFVTSLVERFAPPNVDQDKAHAVARTRAVLRHMMGRLGEAEAAFLEALIAYWGTVSDLVQRQEHGGQKEGKPIMWEDARRVVFQTAVVMFEVDRSLRAAAE